MSAPEASGSAEAAQSGDGRHHGGRGGNRGRGRGRGPRTPRNPKKPELNTNDDPIREESNGKENATRKERPEREKKSNRKVEINHSVDLTKYAQMIRNTESNFSDIKTTSSHLEECMICCKMNDIFGMGDCRHPMCIECALRHYVLGQKPECPTCRQTFSLMYFLFASAGLETVQLSFPRINHPDENKYNLRFQNKQVSDRYDQYLSHVCKICQGEDGGRLEFPTFMSLRQHMGNVHQLTYCHHCLANLNLFSRERATYSKEQLREHTSVGDRHDKSMKGHPKCLFCEQRFFNDILRYTHLRKDHFFCQICETLGQSSNVFFNKHHELTAHYQSKHFPCDNADCKSAGIAFPTKMDLTYHQAKEHGEGRRGITVDFQFSDRQVGGNRRRVDPPVQMAPAPAPPPPPSNVETIVVPSAQLNRLPPRYGHNHRGATNFNSVADFPGLPGTSGSINYSSAPPVVVPSEFPRLKPQNNVLPKKEETKKPVNEFPSLGGKPAKVVQPNTNWGKHTEGFSVIDDDDRSALGASSSGSSKLQQKQQPQPKKQVAPPPSSSSDFPSLPAGSYSSAVGIWGKKNKSVITGCVVPKKNKPAPVPEYFLQAPPQSASSYQPPTDEWVDVKLNKKQQEQREKEEFKARMKEEKRRKQEEKRLLELRNNNREEECNGVEEGKEEEEKEEKKEVISLADISRMVTQNDEKKKKKKGKEDLSPRANDTSNAVPPISPNQSDKKKEMKKEEEKAKEPTEVSPSKNETKKESPTMTLRAEEADTPVEQKTGGGLLGSLFSMFRSQPPSDAPPPGLVPPPGLGLPPGISTAPPPGLSFGPPPGFEQRTRQS